MKITKYLNLLFVCITALILSACIKSSTPPTAKKTIKPSTPNTGNTGTNDNIDKSLSFSGISSIEFKTDSSVKINWSASNSEAVSYDIYNTTTATPVLMTTVVGKASNSALLSSLTPGATYKFRVRMKTSTGLNDGNTKDISITMIAAPPTPSGLTLLAPAINPGFIDRATIQVRGVRSGDDIKLYTDSACVTTPIAVGTAAGATIDLEITDLTIAGKYNFYAKATNSARTSSDCSNATTSYSYVICPSGYVKVPGSTYLGVGAFCVMQFEARKEAGTGPASSLTDDADESPWTSISQENAQAECSNLGSSHYDLISNREWLTIAHSIESTPSNWSGNAVGSGMIPRGNSNGTGVLAITDGLEQPVGSGWEQKRTHTLFNGSVIWDLAGNVWEWVDWDMEAGLQLGPKTCTNSTNYVELTAISCTELEAISINYLPLTTGLSSTHGIGKFSGGPNGGALRGGDSGSGVDAGIFMLDLYNPPTGIARSNFGFRCVYRAEKN